MEVSSLPAWVSRYFEHVGVSAGAAVCGPCLTAHGARSAGFGFRGNLRVNHTTLRCSTGGYSCNGKGNLIRVVEHEVLARSWLLIPPYAPADVCRECYWRVVRDAKASADDAHHPAAKRRRLTDPPRRCECAAASLLSTGWGDPESRKLVRALVGKHPPTSVPALGDAMGLRGRNDMRTLGRPLAAKRNRRSDALEEQWLGAKSVAQVIREFWATNSHPCPSQRLVSGRSAGKSGHEFSRYVTTTYGGLFEKFDAQHPGVAKEEAFRKLRPFFVKPPPSTPRIRCKFHTTMKHLLDGFLSWRKRFHAQCQDCVGLRTVRDLRDLSAADLESLLSCLDEMVCFVVVATSRRCE